MDSVKNKSKKTYYVKKEKTYRIKLKEFLDEVREENKNKPKNNIINN